MYFKQLSKDDGLPTNNVECVIQDSDGFIWFGTHNGLSRYDGHSFLNFMYSPSDTNGVSNDIISCIEKDNEDHLWIGTSQGLNCFDLKTYKFKHYFRTNDALASIRISSLYLDQRHTLWIGTNGGLYRYNLDNQKLIVYKNNQQDTSSLINNEVRSICEDKNHHFWFGTDIGLERLDTSKGIFSHYLKGNFIKSILSDSKGKLWVGIQTNGVWYSPGTDNPIFSKLTGIPDISKYLFSTMLEDKRGNLWFAVRDAGIFYLKAGQNKWIDLLSDKYNLNAINSNVPQALYEDYNGNIWIGTFDKGVDFLDKNRKPFLHIKDNFLPNGLQNNKVRSAYQDNDGDIWIGTRVGGMLSKFDRNSCSFIHYKHDPKNQFSISDETVLCILEDRPGYLWLGTYIGGLNLFNKKTGKCTIFKNNPNNINSISQNSIYSLLKANDGKLWIGTMFEGLDIYDPVKKTFKHYKNTSSPKSLSDNQVRGYLYQDQAKNIWVGTLNGLNLYNPSTDDFTRFLSNPQDSLSISDNRIYCIYEDKKGNLWISTNGGLNLMDRRNNTFTAYKQNDGLPSNAIYGILEDDHGNLWLSSVNGLSKFNPEKKTFQNYTVEDGLQGNEFSQYTFYKLNNSEMIFGGNNGFTLFHPDNIVVNSIVPPVSLTDFKIFNKSVPISDEKSVLKNHISHTKEITLKYSQSVFTFEFAALNYTSPEKNQYAYIMEGFEKEWNYVGRQRNATYTNLNPGEYTFRVKASNNDGIWNEKGTYIKIIILPPWWQTLWFRFILFAVLAGVIYWVYKWRVQERDLAAQRRMEAAVTKERNLLRTLINNIPDSIYVKDTACRKTISNLADVRNVGFHTEAEVLGKDDFELFPKELAESFIADDRTVIQTGQPVVNKEEYVIDEKGQRRWLLTTKLPLYDEKDQTIGLVGIGRDITEQKKIEVEREQLISKLQNALADVRTLSGLVPICSSCKKIRDDKGYWTQLEGYIQEHSLAKFSHGICPECAEKLYGDLYAKMKKQQDATSAKPPPSESPKE
ncbi:MAG: two-component regulator propeller domain-containing protein [Bacteroidota bacterium]